MIDKIFLLSGTPGTGKTSIAQYITDNYQLSHISLSETVIQNNLFSEVDEERDTKIVDEDKLAEYLTEYLVSHEGDLLIEGHYADLVESDQIQAAIILRCQPEILSQRLAERQYSPAKINENVQAEIVGDCTSYMLEKDRLMEAHCIFEIDTGALTLDQSAELCYQIFYFPSKYTQFLAGNLSWMSDSSIDLSKFLD